MKSRTFFTGNDSTKEEPRISQHWGLTCRMQAHVLVNAGCSGPSAGVSRGHKGTKMLFPRSRFLLFFFFVHCFPDTLPGLLGM